MIIGNQNLFSFLNGDFVSGLANASQFYNIYQSTKAGTYAQMNNELNKQTDKIEHDLDVQTMNILDATLEHLEKIEKQNEEIIFLLGGGSR